MLNILTEIFQTTVTLSEKPQECKLLAEKYKVPFDEYNRANAGCPGILNPLGEQPDIELKWGFPGTKEDKNMRFDAFYYALKTYEAYCNNNIELLKNNYLKLNIYGRVMFINVVKQNPQPEKVLKEIAPFVTDGLVMDAIPFPDKHTVTVKRMFDHYIKSEIDPYIKLVTTGKEEETKEPLAIDTVESLVEKLALKQMTKEEVRPLKQEEFELLQIGLEYYDYTKLNSTEQSEILGYIVQHKLLGDNIDIDSFL